MHRRWLTTAALPIAAALTLSGCSGDQGGSTATVTVTAGADAGGSATTGAPASGGTAGDAAAATSAAGAAAGGDAAAASSADAASQTLSPAAERTFDLEDKREVSAGDTAFTLTVHKVTVHDYYVEAEVTLINDAAADLTAWWGGTSTAPRLFDETGRNYPFITDAGHIQRYLVLQPGQGADAVLVFTGRVPDDAEQLTLDFADVGRAWTQLSFDVPMAGAR